ncbi:odorant receptor 13a-like isoform X2 [Prorops nasuta]|uniref:odorant receptor 13a-like isoform X2 n=1 Tax=Prorops nasuta TaxID=863751 RepID=UPI0034CFC6F0
MIETYAMKVIRISLITMGLWPEEHRLEKEFSFLRYRFLLPLAFLVLLMFIPQTANLFVVYNDLVLITENLTTVNFPVIVVFMKFFVMKSYKKVLGDVIESYTRDWENLKDREDTETMMKGANIAGRISIGCYVLTEITASIKMLQQLFAIIRSEINGLDRIFILQSLFPPIFKVTPYYQAVCLGQVIGAYCLATSYAGVDCLVYLLVFHICGQFQILHRSLIRTINSPKILQNPKRFGYFLAIIVRKHEYLNWFAEAVEDSFNVCFLVQVLFSTLLMCFQYFLVFRAVSRSEGLAVNDVAFMVTYVIANMLFIYFYCYMGELLIVASAGMRNAALESNWYMLTPNNMRMVIFILFRSRKPLKLTAGKFSVLSMETYSSIVKTAAGYMSVMVGIESNKDDTV